MAALTLNSALDQHLFNAEIRASVAHCNALFRAGILTRLESERLKNALFTVAKRAEVDRHYFEQLPAPNVFEFVERRLFQLVNQATESLRIGRGLAFRRSVALRLWLSGGITNAIQAIEISAKELSELGAREKPPLLFGEAWAAFAGMLRRDAAAFEEVHKRTRILPRNVAIFDVEELREFDFESVARELDFTQVAESSLDSLSDRDFCLEFASAAAMHTLHVARLANELLCAPNKSNENARRPLELLRGATSGVFGGQTALLTVLPGLPLAPVADLEAVDNIVFEIAEMLESCLQMTNAILVQLINHA